MSAAAEYSLLAVPLDRLTPHERVDPRRAQRLADRIEESGMLRNPIMAMHHEGHPVVLDGANRTGALRQLGCRYAVVQDVRVDDGVELASWRHQISGVEPDELETHIRSVAGVSLDSIESPGHGELHLANGRRWAVHVPGDARIPTLAALADSYLGWAQVHRIDTDRGAYGTSLLRFPAFGLDDVLGAAMAGDLLPAGVTRFIVPRRVLRIDVPLGLLRDPRAPTSEIQAELDLLVEERASQGRVRTYHEPVVLFDE